MSNIPKVINFCWFGGNELDENSKQCIASWKKIMPNYEIKMWDESNYDINKHPFLKEAYDNKKWAFVSDYARLDIIYNYGGIYLDTDVEVLKSFDDLLDYECFMGIEDGSLCVATGLGFGAVANNDFIKENLDVYDNLKLFNENTGKMNLLNCPIITTNLLKKYGFDSINKNQVINNIYIFSSEYFCPMNYNTGIVTVTENTYSIHKYNMSWVSGVDKCIYYCYKYCFRLFGNKIGNYFGFLLSVPFKVFKKIKKRK